MSGSYTQVTIVGNLGRDPEIRCADAGIRIASMTVATSDRWKDRSGTRQERTHWHRIVIFNETLIAIAEQYLRKGAKVLVTGQLENRKWIDKHGEDRWSTEIVLRYRGELVMLDPPKSQQQSGVGWTDSAGRDAQAAGSDLDDDIRF